MKSTLSPIRFFRKLNGPCPRALGWKLALFLPALGLAGGGLAAVFHSWHLVFFLMGGFFAMIPTLWVLASVSAFFAGFSPDKREN